MKESTHLSHSLAVCVRDASGRIKTERYVKDGVEFVPNRLYLWLRRRGWIEPDTFKIVGVLGTRKARE